MLGMQCLFFDAAVPVYRHGYTEAFRPSKAYVRSSPEAAAATDHATQLATSYTYYSHASHPNPWDRCVSHLVPCTCTWQPAPDSSDRRVLLRLRRCAATPCLLASNALALFPLSCRPWVTPHVPLQDGPLPYRLQELQQRLRVEPSWQGLRLTIAMVVVSTK